MCLALGKVLIIEDERACRVAMEDYLRRKGIPVISAVNGAQGLDLLDSDVAVVVTDLKMPKMDGMTVVRGAREKQSRAEVIVVTAYGDIASAVEATKLGAADYLTKPVDPDELYLKIRRILDARTLQRENSELRRQVEEQYGFEAIIGISSPMIAVFERIQSVAPTNATVLITGESGTGKELVARALHHHSPRRSKPFVVISGGAIPDTLVESELFGHVRGAFTGAMEDRAGRFEAANSGTLFIDEVAEVNLGTQAKLLRVLEDRTFSPVGSNESREVDIRLIFATNKDLKNLVREKAFRQDLFYRTVVVTIQMPPLRERREDIPLLARHFVKQLAREHADREIGISPEALKCLRRHDWPGNVRELRNCIESVVVLLRKNEIGPDDLPEEVRSGRPRSFSIPAFRVGMSLEDLEREAIEKTLRKVGGVRVRAAEILGLNVRTLQRKIAEYGLEV